MKGHHPYTLIGEFISDPGWQKFASAVILGGVLVALGAVVTARLRTAQALRQHIVPDKGFSLVGFFDFFVEAFVKYHDSIVGPENRRYVSFSGTVFLFVLSANMLGLIPGMAAITTTVWINVGMAIVVFIYFNYLGLKTHGLKGYFKHFCGPLPLLAILILPVEIFSTCLRILTLNLRLYWNITADHVTLEKFTGLVPLAGVPAYALGTFVSFIQALIFASLTMVYILLAVQHDEEH